MRPHSTIPPRCALLLALAAAACDGGTRADGDSAAAAASGSAAVALGPLDTLVLSPAGAGSAEPNLAVGDDGRVYLSWLEPLGGRTHGLRFASAAASDARWTEPRTIVADTNLFVNWADFPSLLPLPDGGLVAHWLQRSGRARAAYDVRLARSADGGTTWSVPVSPHTDGTASEHGFVSLWPAADTGGGAAPVGVLWLDGRKYAAAGGGHDAPAGHAGGEMQVMSGVLRGDGTASGEHAVDARVCDCCQTSAARTAHGPLVVYRDRSSEEIRDISATRLVDGRWTTPVPVHADGWEIAACPVNGPAVDARGERAAVAWFTAAQDTARVRVAFSDDAGATWAAPVRADDGDPVGRVDVALLGDGSALLLWLERTGGEGAAVRLRRVAPDGTLGDAVTIAESEAARASGFPRMAHGGGWVYVAWTAPGTPSRVRVARLRLGGDA